MNFLGFKIRFPQLPRTDATRKKRRRGTLERDRIFTAARLDSSVVLLPPAFLNQRNGEGARGLGTPGRGGWEQEDGREGGGSALNACIINRRPRVYTPDPANTRMYFRRPTTVISCRRRPCVSSMRNNRPRLKLRSYPQLVFQRKCSKQMSLTEIYSRMKWK